MEHWDRCVLLNVVIKPAEGKKQKKARRSVMGMKTYRLSAAREITGIFCGPSQFFDLWFPRVSGYEEKRGCAIASVC